MGTLTANPAAPAWNEAVRLIATLDRLPGFTSEIEWYERTAFDVILLSRIRVSVEPSLFQTYRVEPRPNTVRQFFLRVLSAPFAGGGGRTVREETNVVSVTWPGPDISLSADRTRPNIDIDNTINLSWTRLDRGDIPNDISFGYTLQERTSTAVSFGESGTFSELTRSASVAAPAVPQARQYRIDVTPAAGASWALSNVVAVQWVQSSVALAVSPRLAPAHNEQITLTASGRDPPDGATYNIQYQQPNGLWTNLASTNFADGGSVTDLHPGGTSRTYRAVMYRRGVALPFKTSSTARVVWQRGAVATLSVSDATPAAGSAITLTATASNVPAGVTPYYEFAYRVGAAGGWTTIGVRGQSATRTPAGTNANRRDAGVRLQYRVLLYGQARGGNPLAPAAYATAEWQPAAAAPVSISLRASPESPIDGNQITLIATPVNAPSGAVYQFAYSATGAGYRAIGAGRQISPRITPAGNIANRRAADTTLYYRVQIYASSAASEPAATATTQVTWLARGQTPVPSITLSAAPNPADAGQDVRLSARTDQAPQGWRVQWLVDRGGGFTRLGTRTRSLVMVAPGQTGVSWDYRVQLYENDSANMPLATADIEVVWQATVAPPTPPPTAAVTATLVAAPASPLGGNGITLTASLSGATATGYTFRAPEGVIGTAGQSSRSVAYPGQPGGTRRVFTVDIAYEGGTAAAQVTVVWRTAVVVPRPGVDDAGELIVQFKEQAAITNYDFGPRFGPTVGQPDILTLRLPYDYQPILLTPHDWPYGVGQPAPGHVDDPEPVPPLTATRRTLTLTAQIAKGDDIVDERDDPVTVTFRRTAPASPAWVRTYRDTRTSLRFSLRIPLPAPPAQPPGAGDTVWTFEVTLSGGDGSISKTATLTWFAPLQWTADETDYTVARGGSISKNLFGAQGGVPPYVYRLYQNLGVPGATVALTAGAGAASGVSMGGLHGIAPRNLIGSYCLWKRCTDSVGAEIWDSLVVHIT